VLAAKDVLRAKVGKRRNDRVGQGLAAAKESRWRDPDQLRLFACKCLVKHLPKARLGLIESYLNLEIWALPIRAAAARCKSVQDFEHLPKWSGPFLRDSEDFDCAGNAKRLTACDDITI
jgi:hypothetical protein